MSTELQDILDLTGQVLRHVEAGEWSEATQIDTERQTRLRNFCATLEPGRTAPEFIASLSEILKLNDALVGVVEHTRRALVREADTVKIGRNAVAAYGAAAQR